ncbi:hypothetical protein EVAR_18608_1 [Eumeta japonica]|uniref:Uncharacterized protein n=1 Tax=Eumeta variegata TaxID=151549 RepID=A0A4C1V4D2_EUMVA|nr:hypothetical protein EVAR_18608_1 [Eumeta japonica]
MAALDINIQNGRWDALRGEKHTYKEEKKFHFFESVSRRQKRNKNPLVLRHKPYVARGDCHARGKGRGRKKRSRLRSGGSWRIIVRPLDDERRKRHRRLVKRRLGPGWPTETAGLRRSITDRSDGCV